MRSPHLLEALLNEYHPVNSPAQSVSRRAKDGFTQWCYVILQRASAIYTDQDKDGLEDEASRLSRKLPYGVSFFAKGKAISRGPRRVSIPSSSDSGSDDYSEDDRNSNRRDEIISRERPMRHWIRREPPEPKIDRSFSLSYRDAALPSSFQPLTDSKGEIHDSNKETGVDQMVQNEDSGYRHTATPPIVVTEPSTKVNKDPGTTNNSNLGLAQDKQSQEVEEPLEDKPSKQAQVHEPSSSSE